MNKSLAEYPRRYRGLLSVEAAGPITAPYLRRPRRAPDTVTSPNTLE
jgi:hypothetical protein